MRVGYTLEQCWHDVPGGTATAAIEVARALAPRPDVTLVGVAGRHRRPPAAPYRSPIPVAQLHLARPLLYEAWLRWRAPRVERVTGPIDVAHATGIVPCATAAPLVVTFADVDFLHEPGRYSRQGLRVMRRSFRVVRDEASLVLAPSRASERELHQAGIDRARLRVVPHGVDPTPAGENAVRDARVRYSLPERFTLFVGTLEPRKNLRRLAAAVGRSQEQLPLVVVGPDGWGDGSRDLAGDVRYLGFLPSADLPAVYAAASVFAYPSEREGFGLPVAEAMAQGTPVVTSAGTATEEVAGGAAVLVDPLDVDAIAAGLDQAGERAGELAGAGRRRAAELTWDAAADATLAAYREALGAGGR